jgi:hypothetical protein
MGHVVLRSPVAHCELNPIEFVRSDVKRYLRNHNHTFKLADLEQLVPAAFSAVTPKMWADHCKHVRSVEETYWEKDGLQEDRVEQFIIEFDVDEEEDDVDVVEVDGDGYESGHDDDENTPEMDENDVHLMNIDAMNRSE